MSTKINDGGPAFPCDRVTNALDGSTAQWEASGMSLRDWFAGMAMQGRLAAGEYYDVENGKDYYATQAKRAYEIADAMIAENYEKVK